jgi:acyl carrier protein
MDRSSIKDQIQSIFRDILDQDDLIIKESDTARDVEGWDSLIHIQLVVSVEKQFKIKFTSKEILSWKNVGEMIDSVITKKMKEVIL